METLTPISQQCSEAELVIAINLRLSPYRMELVTAADAVLGDELNYGKWFVRFRPKPNELNPKPHSTLVTRRVSPLAGAAILNAGGLPK